jgi:rhamnogalacturonyl hydrolase YesR
MRAWLRAVLIAFGASGCACTSPRDGDSETARAGAGGGGYAADIAFCSDELARAAKHYEGFKSAYTNPERIPRSVADDEVRLVGRNDWTSGFPAGSFWLLYEFTEDPAWREAAEERTAALAAQRTRTDTHDLGFIVNNTFGAGLRITGNDEYASVVIDAAESLASRFDPRVGATRSWDSGSWTFPVIIDNMMNLELLFHAARLGDRPELRELAVVHAQTTLENHFRPDDSSYHVVDYDPQTGTPIAKRTHQGLSDESAWARGQAWGLYGFTMCFRETEEPAFLEQAQKIADFYTQHPALPDDGVPYFDFDAPERSDVPDLRDASAGAIAASALLELSKYAKAGALERYLGFAIRAIRSLSSAGYRAEHGQNGHFLLEHSVGNYPKNDEIDVGINYADYYFLEALLRCSRLN